MRAAEGNNIEAGADRAAWMGFGRRTA